MRTTEITARDTEGHTRLVLRTDSPMPGHDHLPLLPSYRLSTGERLTSADDTGKRFNTLDGRIVVTID